MPRPMTIYASGLRTLRRTHALACSVCGKPQPRTFHTTSVDPEADHAAWLERLQSRPVYCVPCWRRAGRPV